MRYVKTTYWLLPAALLAGFASAQVVDIDENGNLKEQPAATADSRDLLSTARRISVPLERQAGTDIPRRMAIPTGKGALVLDFSEPPPQDPVPAPPRSAPNPFLILAAGLVAAAAVHWAWDKRRSRAAAPVPRPPAPEGASPSENFAIVRSLGQGGMGVVYEAVDRSLDRRVAIKRLRDELRTNPQDAARFLREAKTVAALHHPNIVEIYSVVSQGGDIFLVFEFVEGRTLDAVLAEHGRLGLAQTKAILTPVCQALEFAHSRGVIHRDLKPANVMINAQGQVKVMDFGIARSLRDRSADAAAAGRQGPLEQATTLGGTPCYMAPEAEFGAVCAQSDVWSLGATAYQMLTGRLPYLPTATPVEKTECRFTPVRELVPELPPAADVLVAAALAGDYRRRMPDAAAFRTALAAL